MLRVPVLLSSLLAATLIACQTASLPPAAKVFDNMRLSSVLAIPQIAGNFSQLALGINSFYDGPPTPDMPKGKPFDQRRKEIYLIDSATGAVQKQFGDLISEEQPLLKWSPDRQWILYGARETGTLAIMSAKALVPNQVLLSGTSCGSGVESAAWSPDGGQIACIGFDPEDINQQTHRWQVQVWQPELKSAEPATAAKLPAPLPGNRLQAFSSTLTVPGTAINMFGLLWRNPTQLLASQQLDNGHYALYLIDLKRQSFEKLIEESYSISPLSLSPDGNTLLYKNSDWTQIRRADLVSRQSTDWGAGSEAHFSPDGSQVAFVRDKSLYLAKADGSESTQIAAPEAFGKRTVFLQDWSAEGNLSLVALSEVMLWSRKPQTALQFSFYRVQADTHAIQEIKPPAKVFTDFGINPTTP